MEHKIVEPPTYLRVFAVLMVLMVVTVLASLIKHPALSITIAVTIAVTKAVLIILYFMQVRYAGGLTAVACAAGFVWLLILFALLGGDVLARQDITQSDLVPVETRVFATPAEPAEH